MNFDRKHDITKLAEKVRTTGSYAMEAVALRTAPNGKRYLAAMNGRALVVVPCEVDTDENAPDMLLPRASVETARKHEINRPSHLAIVGDSATGLSVRTRDGATMPAVSGNFPPVERIVEGSETGADTLEIVLDAALLLDLAKALGCDSRQTAVRNPISLLVPMRRRDGSDSLWDSNGSAILATAPRVDVADVAKARTAALGVVPFGIIMPIMRD